MKVRDASNVLKSVAAFHMRDAANVLRTAPAVHMRDAANALKSAYSSGPPPAVAIAPTGWVTSSHTNFANSSNYTATFTGGTPSSIVWSIEDELNADGSVTGGQGTATATVQLITNDSGGDTAVGRCTVRCTAIIAGVTYSATATKQHNVIYGGGGGGGGGGGEFPTP
jgi:hypothetical protein